MKKVHEQKKKNLSELEGTQVVVVGASRGFGRGIVETLVETGAEVHALSRGDSSRPHAVEARHLALSNVVMNATHDPRMERKQ